MLPETLVYLPGQINPTRKPWVGTLEEIFNDRPDAVGALVSKLEDAGRIPRLPEDADDERWITEIAPYLDEADVRALADDPNARVSAMSGQELKDRRTALGLTQGEVAALFDTAQAKISDREKGRRIIPAAYDAALYKLEEAQDALTEMLVNQIEESGVPQIAGYDPSRITLGEAPLPEGFHRMAATRAAFEIRQGSGQAVRIV